jgi:hypothetical protein
VRSDQQTGTGKPNGWYTIARMRARCLVSLVCLLAAVSPSLSCTIWKEKRVVEWSSATGGEQLERLLWQEIKAKNWAEVEQHLASNFVCLTANGALDRPATLELLKREAIADYVLGDFVVQPSGPDVTVTYTITIRGLENAARTLRMMTTWQQVKKGWMATVHAAVPVAGASAHAAPAH